jgi:ribosomal protein S18 acetylase RimI-like enzyme
VRQSIANPTARAEVRAWPLDSTIAHLVLLDVHMVPTAEVVAGWIRDAFESTGIERIRTGALFPAAADGFLDSGFVEIDRLTLLERALHDRVDVVRPTGLATVRLRPRDLVTAAEIDTASFPGGWRHDAASLQEIATATPHARRRLVTTTSAHRSGRRNRRHMPIGFAITGSAGPNGYLQRLAVRPDARRNGAARLLVADALDWLVRRGARRAMVNTGIDNQAALDLYRHAGFEQLRDELVVVELTRPT